MAAAYTTQERIALNKKLFNAILNASDGNYIIQAIILAAVKPEGW